MKAITIFALVCIFAVSCFALPKKKATKKRTSTTASVVGSSCGTKCGTERWPLKTLTDPEAAAFKSAPVNETTVSMLISQTAPSHLTNSRSPLEKQLFHMTALLIGWKIEDKNPAFASSSGKQTIPDRDFHIVVADPNDTKKQMIIEVPDSTCQAVCSSAFLDKFKAARTAVSDKLGQPKPQIVTLPKPWLVEVTGPGLFDFVHGQDGLAPNCVELHPVLEIKFVQEQGSSSVHINKASEIVHRCGIR